MNRKGEFGEKKRDEMVCAMTYNMVGVFINELG
jgi:hypothetical protein